jgi:hypothetical protein
VSLIQFFYCASWAESVGSLTQSMAAGLPTANPTLPRTRKGATALMKPDDGFDKRRSMTDKEQTDECKSNKRPEKPRVGKAWTGKFDMLQK